MRHKLLNVADIKQEAHLKKHTQSKKSKSKSAKPLNPTQTQ